MPWWKMALEFLELVAIYTVVVGYFAVLYYYAFVASRHS